MFSFSQWIEEAKKKSRPDSKNQDTAVSAPIKGANQDRSGEGVSHDAADYTISDAKVCPACKNNPCTCIDEAKTPAWSRKEGKNPEGGLNRKGIASYRAEHPGSKLSLAVTTKPSKLKPGSKAANRRKSFCARMSGMKGPMKDEKGRPTRKALSLRKWNCHEEVNEATKQRLDPSCWTGKHKEGTKMKNGIRVNNCVPNESVKEGIAIAGVGDVRSKPVNMAQSTGGSKALNAPANASRMQNAANQRVAQLDKMSQQKKDQQVKDREQEVKQRTAVANKPQQPSSLTKPVSAKPAFKPPVSEENTDEGYIHIGPADGSSPYDKWGNKKPGTRTLGNDSKWARRDKEPRGPVKKNINDRLTTTREEVESVDEASSAMKSLASKKKSGTERAHKETHGISSKRFAVRQTDKSKPTKHKVDIHVVTAKGEERKYQDEVHAKDKHSAIFQTQRKYAEFGKKMGYSIDKVVHKGMVKEEVEGIDEASKATVASYSYKAGRQVTGNQPSDPDKLRKRNNREQGLKLAYNKFYGNKVKVPATEEVAYVDEAKKESEARDLGDRHIIMQARKVISTRGAHHITFADGKTHAVNPMTAHRLIAKHDSLAKPADKEAFAAHAHSSLSGMKDAMAGKKPEVKPAISLGGSKNVGGIRGPGSK